MSSPSALLPLFLFFSLLISSSLAFNITNILSKHSDFSAFNDLLTKTKLADQINNRQTITVLAVDNSAASSLSGMSSDQAKAALSLHVILDYYDKQKLQKLQNKTTLLTTLFQASGQAGGQHQGFVNATVLSSGNVAFGSASPGASLNANLVDSVDSQPYNISVLQVSSVISPSGSGSPSSAPAGSPSNSPGSPKMSPLPSARPPRSAKSPSSSDGNSTSEDMSPSDGKAPSPSDATSPMGSSPPLPGGAAAGPAADSVPAADAPGTASGAVPGSIFGSSVKLGVVVMIFWSLFLVV